MINKLRLTRILSVILTATLLLSALPTVGFFASAAEESGAGANFSDDAVIRMGLNSKDNSTFFANTGMSLVKTLPTSYDVYNEGGEWVEKNGIQDGSSAYLADRDIEGKYFYNTTKKFFESTNHYMCSRRGYTTKRTDGQKDEYGSNIAEDNDAIKVDGTKYAVDIVHDLQKVENVSRVLINHHPTKVLRAGHYYLYASETLEDLFNDAKSLVYKNYYDHVEQLGQAFIFNTPVKARYVAIRVFNPYSISDPVEIRSNPTTGSAGNAYIRMFEFNVFGDLKEGADVVENRKYSYKLKRDDTDPSVPEYTYNEEIEDKNSLIANRTPSAMFFMRDGEEYDAVTRAAGADVDSTWLTDNDTETATEIRDKNNTVHKFADGTNLIDDEEKMYLQFNYKLDGEASVSNINLFYHENDDFAAGHIKISVADTEENLFQNVKNSYITKDIYSVFGGVTKVKLANPQKGSYVGIRIICPVKKKYKNAENFYARIAEISVYGNYTSTSNGINYRYNFEGSNLTKNGNAKIEYQCNPDLEGKYSANTKVKVTLPASSRDSEGKLHSLKSWTVTNPTMSGSDTIIEFGLGAGATASITALYGTSNKPPVTITFKNYWGEVIHTASVTYGHFLSRGDYEIANSKLGDVPGKELKYAEYHFGSRIAEMPVWNEDIYNYAAGADVTFTPVYATSGKTYTVTYPERRIGTSGNQTTETITREPKQCRFGQKIICEIPNTEYWTVNDDVWCVGETFIGYVSEDMEVKEITDKSLAETAVVSIARNPVVTGSSVGFAGRIALLPDGAAIKEVGLLLVGGGFPAEDAITLQNCQQKISAEKRNGNDFMITVTNMPKKVSRRAVVYLTYSLENSNESITVYSEQEATVTMP